MKSLVKLGLLLALVVAGRYLQLTAPAEVAGLRKPTVEAFAPLSSIILTRYISSPPAPVVPVDQRRKPAPAWY